MKVALIEDKVSESWSEDRHYSSPNDDENAFSLLEEQVLVNPFKCYFGELSLNFGFVFVSAVDK